MVFHVWPVTPIETGRKQRRSLYSTLKIMQTTAEAIHDQKGEAAELFHPSWERQPVLDEKYAVQSNEIKLAAYGLEVESP